MATGGDLNLKKWTWIKRLLESRRFPHAVLISGVSSREFMLNVFGEDVIKKAHPDFIFIEPKKKEITIDQIRNCIWRLSLKPSVFDFKIALIDKAHTLNQEAYSAFLKTLEEPKGNTFLILITDYPALLPSTILSRVQKIKFYPTNEFDIDHKQSNDIKWLMGSDIVERFQYVEEVANSTELNQILINWLYYFHKDIPSNKRILKLLNKMITLTSRTNVNPRLALELLMLEVPVKK